jgi:hypothetical protein
MLVPAAAHATEFLGHAHVSIIGTGSGEVTSVEGFGRFGGNPGVAEGSPALECSYTSPGPATGTCENEMERFAEGSELGYIAMEAVPAPGSEFAGWTVEEGFAFGSSCAETTDCAGGNFEGETFKLTAKFTALANPTSLTVAKTGEGTVISSPKGIECGSKCEYIYEGGSSVTLTASPATGYAFNSWAGCTEHVGLTCKVTMDKAKTVKASFIATPSFTVEKTGSGQGKVGAPGISCDENCSTATSAIKTGASVTVKVTPAKGSEAAVFEEGTGSASSCSGASCTFTISEASSVKVKFDPKPTTTLTVNLTGPAAYKGKVTGKGTVKGLTASAIACGAGCTTQTESFFEGDTVTLSAVAGTGYAFAGWDIEGFANPGTCEGTTTPCTISTNGNKTLSAEFK